MNMAKRNYIQIDDLEKITFLAENLRPEYLSGTLIGISAFVDASDEFDFFQQRTFILSFFDKHFSDLPVSVISQAANRGVVFEIWKHEYCIGLKYKKINEINYTVYEDEMGKAVWCFGCTSADSNISFEEQACRSFNMMQAVLSEENLSMDNLIRQWNYLPAILKTETKNKRIYQNYQLFNEIRQSYYERYKKNRHYPSATGIGMDYGAVSIDFAALQPNENVLVTGLENPCQTNAYRYGQKILVGSPAKENEPKKPPLFERAKYAGWSDRGTVFISGTAAIAGEKTVGLNDFVRQTILTIENIANLIAPQNLVSKYIPAANTQYVYLRVYVKDKKDMNIVKKISEKYYRNIPILYVEADICRNDLLVEIEGEAEVGNF
jgi:enamine deaminase RidA (YjgF/YER057c/UK114 family)